MRDKRLDKILMARLNQVSSFYFGRIMYALFFLSILEALISFIVLSPALSLSRSGEGGIFYRGLIVALAFLALCLWLTFQFGFAIMLLRMTRRKSTDLGYLFIGFRCLGHAGKITVFLGFFVALLVVVARLSAKFIFMFLRPDFSFELSSLSALRSLDSAETASLVSAAAMDSLLFIGIFIIIFLLLGLLVLTRFAFVFQLHFDNPGMRVTDVFKRSSEMMEGNVLRLIFFAVRAGGRQLALAVFFSVLLAGLPKEKGPALMALTFVMDIIYFVNLYTAMIRIRLTVPVLYDRLLSPADETEESGAAEDAPPQNQGL